MTFFGGECSECEMPCAYIMVDGEWVCKCPCVEVSQR